MSINDFLDGDQTPETVTPADAVSTPAEINDGSDFFEETPPNNVPDDTTIYPEQTESEVEQQPAVAAALESIREDLTGLVNDTETASPQTEFVVDIVLDDDSKTLLDNDLAEIIARDPEILESLESIALTGERSVKTIITILGDKIEQVNAK